MSADVETVYRYRAYCESCGWWGGLLDSQDRADNEADAHDAEYHAGVSDE